MYTSLEVSPSPEGTEKSSIPASAKGIAIRSIHERHLPKRDFVLSTITPIIGIIKKQKCGHCGVDYITAKISAAIRKNVPKS